MNSGLDDAALPAPGFPIRKSPDQSLLSGSPKLFAASHVLHRLLAPRHPPCALSSLTTKELSVSRIRYPYAIVKDQLDEPGLSRIRSAHRLAVDRTHPTSRVTTSGADRSRTDGLRLARAALSQLSYSPIASRRPHHRNQVGLGRVELPTSPLSGVRSNQLSYRPNRPRRSFKTREWKS